ESFVNLGIAERQAARRDEARAALSRALEIDPRSAEASYNLALIADEAGDRQQALARYRAFLQYGAVSHPELVPAVRARIAVLGKIVSRVLSGICGSAALGSVLAHDIGDEPSAVLEMVRGRQAERLLQLRRPASRQVQKQSRPRVCSGTGKRAGLCRHLPGT